MFDEEIYSFSFYKYMKDISEGKIIASKYTILQCKKLINDIEKSKDESYPYYFDVKIAKNVISIISNMKFEDGQKAGQPLKLANFQMSIILNTFCWRFKEDSTKFRFKNIVVFIPRKNGKSYIIAILAILSTMKEAGGEAVIAAGNLKQATIMYNQICGLIKSYPSLSKAFKVLRSEIRCLAKNSKIKALTSNAKNMDGINPHFVAIDEAMVVDRAVKSSLLTGSMMRKSVQNFYISTEYNIEMKSGWMDEQIEYSQNVLDGIIEDDRILSFIYRLENAEEISDEKNWIKANPILPEIDDSELKEKYQKALVSPSEMKDLLIKNFNVAQSIADDNAYLDIEKWKACRSEEPIDWKGIHVNVGVDLSKTTDLTAVSFTGTDEEGNVLVHSYGFLPEDSLLSGNRREKIDYRKMEQLGYCTINEGGVIDYDIVKQYIINIEKKFGCIIDTIQFDMYNALMMANELAQEGFNVVECKQNILTLSYPTKTFREKVYLGQVRYDKNELLDWCVSCAITEEDRNGNEKISKNKSQKNNKRIDMIAAVIFSYAETVKTEIKPKFNIDAFGIIDC
ncbi:terminase large subunit [Clostridium perfringens]|nr:terminase large subunit [Clostridium perfringens]MDK0957881.1 terminase large subunit [Clostridium perfringens]MDM0501449.1 terminase large subunit [Clostridium perfringens]